MKIDRILLLACDRPDFLRRCLDRIMPLGVDVVCVLDKPSEEVRMAGWESCLAILEKSDKVVLFQNKENLGCSNSMYKLLENRHDGINLVIEDDIILKEGFESFISSKHIDSPFVMKLSQFYWGWIADGAAIDAFRKFRTSTGSCKDKKQLKTIEYQAVEAFRKSNTFFPFDELFDICIRFLKINCISGLDLTENIGIEKSKSSRLQNKSEGVIKTALFKNGILIEIEEL